MQRGSIVIVSGGKYDLNYRLVSGWKYEPNKDLITNK